MVDSTLARGYGTLAGLGFIGAALFAIPSTLLLEPRPETGSYLVSVAGLVTGLVCMALPWERINPKWLHAVGVIATVEAAIAVAVFGQPYAAFFFLIGVLVAYVAPYPRIVAGHLALIGVALVAPVAYGPASAIDTLQLALVVFPNLALTVGIFAYLRLRMVADRLSYRRFAEQTLSLANRIAGRPVTATDPPSDPELLAWSRRYRIPARASAVAAAILSVPLVTAGLAAAGVKLPPFASTSFAEVGIHLPNQGSEHGSRAERETIDRAVRNVQPGGLPDANPGIRETRGAGQSTPPGRGAGGDLEPSRTAPDSSTPGQLDGADTDTSTSPSGGTNDPGGSPDAPPRGPIGEALDKTLLDLQSILNMNGAPDAGEAEPGSAE